MGKYFQEIPKDWKEQDQRLRCEQCGSDIEEGEDHFTVAAHWKIKDEPDEYWFCSLDCVEDWAAEPSLEEMD